MLGPLVPSEDVQEPPLAQLCKHLSQDGISRSRGLCFPGGSPQTSPFLAEALTPESAPPSTGSCHMQACWKMPSRSLLSEELLTALVSF